MTDSQKSPLTSEPMDNPAEEPIEQQPVDEQSYDGRSTIPPPASNTRVKKRVPKRLFFFSTLAIIAIILYCIVNADSFVSVFNRLGDVLAPILVGCIIAYLCNPFLRFFEFLVFRKMGQSNLRRVLSLLCTILVVFGILSVVIALIVPELIDSIRQLVLNYEYYLNHLLSFVQSIIDKFQLDLDISDVEKFTALIVQLFGTAEEAVAKLLSALQGLTESVALFDNIWAFVVNLFNTFKNLLLGLFIALYILSSKEKRKAQISKFRAAFFSDHQNEKITTVVKLVDQTFGGYIKGLLLDALAVGVVTFLLLSICKVSEYNLLIAAICAVTNIIPVFGPFIGAIPSGLIVLISNPEKFILFVVLILIIQQIDGNILCPIIQGNNTGVSSLAVIIAITVMGGFFGIIGMVIGVPVFAVIIELVKQTIESRLTKQGKATDTTHYYPVNAVGNAEEDVYYEHAHWKYKYDHSRLKPHVDKFLAAVGRIRKKKKSNGKNNSNGHKKNNASGNKKHNSPSKKHKNGKKKK